MTKKELTENIREFAMKLGFTNCGFSKAIELIKNKESLINSINNGYTAEMTYLQNNLDKRANPTLLIENAKTVISVLLSY
jgi:epoxyqueuosine reductase